MLQFLTTNRSKYSAAEEVQMAIEGGCKWIELSTTGKSLDEVKEEAKQIIPICTETDTFMIIEHDVELVHELRVHGVHLTPGDMLPRQAREALGPHAVIGVTVTTAAEIVALKNADIDYVRISGFPSVTLDDYRKIAQEVSEAGVTIPIVAGGEISKSDLKNLMNTGINGITMSLEPMLSDCPVGYIKDSIEILSEK